MRASVDRAVARGLVGSDKPVQADWAKADLAPQASVAIASHPPTAASSTASWECHRTKDSTVLAPEEWARKRGGWR